MRSHRTILIIAALAVVVLALALRLPGLSLRPLHGDEAVNAAKFRLLWEAPASGYQYDPAEYHGPVLPYATLPVVPLLANDYPQTTELDFRLVTVLFGVALVVLTLCAGPGIGWPAAVIAALLTAISTAMVFYSRYYIHEMPLVVFTFAAILCGWRYAVRPSLGWAAAGGAMLALMHASKETAILAWFAMAVGLAGAAIVRAATVRERSLADRPAEIAPLRSRLRWSDMALALAAFMVTYILLFSSFFTNWPGVIDGVRTFFLYADRGTGGEPLHVHPWYWYLTRLIYFRAIPGARAPWFSEGLIPLLALIGLIAAATRRGIDPRHLPLARFMAIYTLVLTVAYAAIPYKTPWCVLSFLHGMIVLAGIGAVALIRSAPAAWGKAIIAVVLAAAAGHLTYQSYRANFVLHTHRLNPWVYAHPVGKVREVEERINELAAVAGDDMKVLFAPGAENLWPVPFYLRTVPVSWYTAVPHDADAPVLLVSADAAPSIAARLGARYEGPHYYGVRPGETETGDPQIVHVAMFVRNDVWERFMASRK